MSFRGAIVRTLSSKRFWVWQVCGAVLYSIPVAIRFAIRSSYIPVLSLPGFWVDHYIPGNLVEKFLVNAFFPGGAGAVAGEIFASNYGSEVAKGKTLYLARLGGALVQTTLWTTFQFWGYSQWIIGSFGGNLFEIPYVYPFNFSLACLSIFTPDIVSFARTKLTKAWRKLREIQRRKWQR